MPRICILAVRLYTVGIHYVVLRRSNLRRWRRMPTPPEPEKVTLAFAKALQKLRKRTGLSQEDLAHQADIDRAYMSALERGLHNPTIGLIFRLVIPLRVSPAEFVAEMERQLRRLNAARNIG